MSGLDCHFAELPDPRAGNSSHHLGDIVVMMIAASLCGASNATEYSLFAETRKPLLNRLIRYDRAPSHDTFSRVLRLLDPEAFLCIFAAFAAAFHQAMRSFRARAGAAPEVIAVDGKSLRRAYETGQAASPPMMVSAFAAECRLCLGAGMAMPHDNEGEAALKVVELLDLTGRIVTADALHCTRRMAQTIRGRGGDYVLALKGNRREWLKQAKQLFDTTPARIAEVTRTGHGRAEWHRSEVVAAPAPLMDGHKAFARITSARGNGKPVIRYFMASQSLEPDEMLAIIRSHWSIENNLHWVLDVHMREDHNRARKDNAPANTAIINRIARNILQIIDKPKTPISHRIKKCAWNEEYLLNAITHMR